MTDPTPARIRAIRTEYGTQAEAAAALGVSLRTITNAEADPDYKRRRLYALALLGLLHEEGIEPPPHTKPAR